jgi:hypothetical protein
MLGSTYEYSQKLAVTDDRLASVLHRARKPKNIPLGTRIIDWISQLTFQSLIVHTTCCNITKVQFVEKCVNALNMTVTPQPIFSSKKINTVFLI